MASAEMTLATFGDDQRVGVRVGGEIDLTSSPRLAEQLQQLIATGGRPRVEIDMERVTFLDSTGLAALVAAHRQASERSVTLIVVAASPQVQRVLRTSQLDHLIGDGR